MPEKVDIADFLSATSRRKASTDCHNYSISQVQDMLTRLSTIVSSGTSIAVATDYAACTVTDFEPVRKAMKDMTPLERHFWDPYTAGEMRLPPVDWADPSSREPEPTNNNPKRLAAWRRRAEALSRIYKTDETTVLTPGHAAWFTKHHVVVLPVVTAMERVIGAERNLNGGAAGLSAVQMADLQTINAVLSASSMFLARGGGGSAASGDSRAIQMSQMVLGRHRNVLRRLLREAGKVQARKHARVVPEQ